jgi:hypothetical protein
MPQPRSLAGGQAALFAADAHEDLTRTAQDFIGWPSESTDDG